MSRRRVEIIAGVALILVVTAGLVVAIVMTGSWGALP